MIPNLITQSRAPNTLKKYNCYLKKWLEWCSKFQDIYPLPTKVQYIVLFIVASFQNGKSFTSIEATVSAIKYFHSLINVNFTGNSMVKHVLEGIKRISKHKSKLALTVEQLSLACRFLSKKLSVKSLRMKVIMILSFAGFLRFSECQHIRRSDIKFFQDYAMIFIEKSKTDFYREGHWVLIARTNTELCPIMNLIQYINRVGINADSDEFITITFTIYK